MGLVCSPCTECDFYQPGKACKKFKKCMGKSDGTIYKVQKALSRMQSLSTEEGGLGRGRVAPRTAAYARG